MSWNEQLQQLQQETEQALKNATRVNALEELEISVLGRKGSRASGAWRPRKRGEGAH